jgi:hypothetical protein
VVGTSSAGWKENEIVNTKFYLKPRQNAEEMSKGLTVGSLIVRAFCFFCLVGSPVSFVAIKFLFRSCIWNQEESQICLWKWRFKD